MENHGKQALWGFSISRNRPFYLKLQYLWSGQQAVTTGCDNRYQFVRADDIRQIQLVDHLRPTFDIVPNIAKTKKETDLTHLTDQVEPRNCVESAFLSQKNTSNWRLTCWGFARLRDQSNCSWLSRIGSERPWKPLWKSHIDLYISLQESTIVNLGILQDYKINQLSINPHMIVGWSWMVMDGQCTNTHPRFPSW